MEKRHAYLILCYHRFEQLTILLKLLDDPRNDIYICVDSKSGEYPEELLRSAIKKSGLFFVKRFRTAWASYGVIQAEMTLLRESVKRGYAYYHHLSGLDLPLKTQDEIHRFFEENAGKNFIDVSYWHNFNLPQDNQPDMFYLPRVSLYHFFEAQRPRIGPLKERLRGTGGIFLTLDKLSLTAQKILRVNRVKNHELEYYMGSNWFSITHEFASYILSREDFIEKHFRFSHAGDELFVQTILMNSPFRNHWVNDNVRCIDFHRIYRGGPHTFTLEDYDFVMSSGKLFGRKFDEGIDAEIIRKIYHQLTDGVSESGADT